MLYNLSELYYFLLQNLSQARNNNNKKMKLKNETYFQKNVFRSRIFLKMKAENIN